MPRETRAEIAKVQRWGACRDNWPEPLTAQEKANRLTNMLGFGLRQGCGQEGSRLYNECRLLAEEALRLLRAAERRRASRPRSTP